MFGLDMEHCPNCGGGPKIIAAILEQPVVKKILTHLGLGVPSGRKRAFENTNLTSLLLVSFGLAALNAMSGATSLVAILDLLPSGVRAMGLSITYAVGVSLFGGTTQLLVSWLIDFTGSPLAPAWYVAATSLLAAFAVWALPEGSGPAQQA